MSRETLKLPYFHTRRRQPPGESSTSGREVEPERQPQQEQQEQQPSPAAGEESPAVQPQPENALHFEDLVILAPPPLLPSERAVYEAYLPQRPPDESIIGGGGPAIQPINYRERALEHLDHIEANIRRQHDMHSFEDIYHQQRLEITRNLWRPEVMVPPRAALGESCYMCEEDFTFDQMLASRITWCKGSCGQNVHIACLRRWWMSQHQIGAEFLRCGLCRDRWVIGYPETLR